MAGHHDKTFLTEWNNLRKTAEEGLLDVQYQYCTQMAEKYQREAQQSLDTLQAAMVDNPDLFLKAGMTARVRVTTAVIPGVIMIPQSAVLYRKDRREVFVAGPEQKAEVREIELGRSEGALVQVLKGLIPGDRLVVTGGQYLKSGDRIMISDSEQAGTL
jgi:multidrug efflux pump subunit AcrA (membrane-fusion protein)